MIRGAPETVTVEVPFTIRKRGGRKEIVIAPSARPPGPKIDNTLVKALARAFRWQRMLDSGAFATIGDLAAHEQIAPSYLTRVLRLTLLAPTVVEAIVEGRWTKGMAEMLEAVPVEWNRKLNPTGS